MCRYFAPHQLTPLGAREHAGRFGGGSAVVAFTGADWAAGAVAASAAGRIRRGRLGGRGRANFVILEVRDFACFCGSKYAPSM